MGAGEGEAECFVCRKHRDRGVLVPGGAVAEDDLVLVSHLAPTAPDSADSDFGDRQVYLGHLFVEPLRHAPGLADLTDAEAQRVGWWCARASQALRDVAGAEHVYAHVFGDAVPHLHIHLIARQPGTPREYWWPRTKEWPQARRGGSAEVAGFVGRLRDYLGGRAGPARPNRSSDSTTIFDQPTVLHTARLTLRQITEADGPGLFDIFGDDRVTEHYAWDAFTSLTQAQELAAKTANQFRQREALRWGLVLPGADRIIGTCGYTRWNQEHQYAVIGYDLAAAHWRQGLMSEAVAEVLRFGFERMALNRVEASVETGNTASAALLRRMGFTQEGELRERGQYRGAFRDVWILGLTRADWLRGR